MIKLFPHFRNRFLGAAVCLFVLGTLISRPAGYAHADETGYTITSDAAKNSPRSYDQTLIRMRSELSGTVPKKFTINGVEYTGNYYRSGSLTDVFKVYENGETLMLRIPSNSRVVDMSLQYNPMMAKANRIGFPSVRLYTLPSGGSLVTKTEFAKGYTSAREFFERAMRNPTDPEVLKQKRAMKTFAKKYGRAFVHGGSEEGNLGLRKLKNGSYEVVLIDGSDDPKNFKPAPSMQTSVLGEVFAEEKMRAEARVEMGKDLRPMEEVMAVTESLEAELLGAAYPENFTTKPRNFAFLTSRPLSQEPQKLVTSEESEISSCASQGTRTGSSLNPFKAFVSQTFSAVAATVNVTSLVFAAIFPETNPFAGEPIGVPCSAARARKDRIRCTWDTVFLPHHRASCDVIREVRPTGKKSYLLRSLSEEEVCEVTYDSFSFNQDNEEVQKKITATGYFQGNGLKASDGSTESQFNDLAKKWKGEKTLFKPGELFRRVIRILSEPETETLDCKVFKARILRCPGALYKAS